MARAALAAPSVRAPGTSSEEVGWCTLALLILASLRADGERRDPPRTAQKREAEDPVPRGPGSKTAVCSPVRFMVRMIRIERPMT